MSFVTNSWLESYLSPCREQYGRRNEVVECLQWRAGEGDNLARGDVWRGMRLILQGSQRSKRCVTLHRDSLYYTFISWPRHPMDPVALHDTISG